MAAVVLVSGCGEIPPNSSSGRQVKNWSVSRPASTPGVLQDVDAEHAPGLPGIVWAAPGGFYPDTLVENVSPRHTADPGNRSGGQLIGQQEPVVGIHQAKFDQQQLRQVGG